MQENGRNNADQQRRDHHDGGIITSEFCDKVFRLSFFCRGVLHQVKDLAHGGIIIFFAGAKLNFAPNVDGAAEHFLPRLNVARQGFPRQRGGIEGAFSFQHHRVHRHAFPGAQNKNVADLHFLRRNYHFFAVAKHAGNIGADIHQSRNGATRFSHRVTLEQLAHLIKEHHAARFGKVQKSDGSESCHHHQEVFVQKPAGQKISPRLKDHVVTDDQIRRKEGQDEQIKAIIAETPFLRHFAKGFKRRQLIKDDPHQKDGKRHKDAY